MPYINVFSEKENVPSPYLKAPTYHLKRKAGAQIKLITDVL